MPKFIIHHEGFFFEWSTIVDAPTSKAMRRDEFVAWYRGLYGSEGVEQLPARLERAEKYGTSSHDHESARDMILGNRAGPNEEELSFESVIGLLRS